MDDDAHHDDRAPAPAPLHGRVLRPDQFATHAQLERVLPAPALRPWVEHYWSVTWRLREGESFTATTTSEPAVDLTVERGGIVRDGACGEGTWLTGPVSAGRFAATLSGQGCVLGVKLTLGGVRAFPTTATLDLVALRDRTTPAAGWFDFPSAPGEAASAAPVLDDWLSGLRPSEPDGFEDFRNLLVLLRDPSVTTVAALCERSSRSVRSVQRDFQRFVGVGAKRMLLRARVSDAVAALDRGSHIDLARLAADLGWYDQAHFIRDFRAVTGSTPATYRGARAQSS